MVCGAMCGTHAMHEAGALSVVHMCTSCWSHAILPHLDVCGSIMLQRAYAKRASCNSLHGLPQYLEPSLGLSCTCTYAASTQSSSVAACRNQPLDMLLFEFRCLVLPVDLQCSCRVVGHRHC